MSAAIPESFSSNSRALLCTPHTMKGMINRYIIRKDAACVPGDCSMQQLTRVGWGLEDGGGGGVEVQQLTRISWISSQPAALCNILTSFAAGSDRLPNLCRVNSQCSDPLVQYWQSSLTSDGLQTCSRTFSDTARVIPFN